jgi:phage terminase large subunit-like protein
MRAVGTERDYAAIAEQYAHDVTTGKIVACAFVIAACARQLADLERWRDKEGAPFLWNPRMLDSRGREYTPADRVCRFIERLPHVKGDLAGTPIRLEPWQVFALSTAFGWIKPDGRRRFRRVYIEVPRGNGKSALSSAVGLYMLTQDEEPGAEVYSFATTQDQAKIVWGDARRMALKCEPFRERFGVDVWAHSIVCEGSGSKFEAKSAEGSTLDGLNVHFACVDELHAHKTRDVYDVVETGAGKRSQSLLWVITTAGSDRAGICYEVRTYVTKLLAGIFEDDTQFGIVYGLDPDDDWTTEEALRKANPNWGVSVEPAATLALQRKAITLPSATNNFKTKHLNEWVNAASAWLDMRKWDACADASLREADFAADECVTALDLASKIDIAARVNLYRRAGVYYAFPHFYLPEETAENATNSQYSGWARSAKLTLTPGSVLDFDYIERDLLLTRDALKQLREVPFDPWQATQLATRMMAEGLPMVECRATVQNFSEPMKELQALIYRGALKHDGNPVLTWMVSNVVCMRDAKDNIYPRKERDENKIDGVVALIMALGRFIAGTDPTSVYESQGMATL